MSAKFNVTYGIKEFQIEITREGNLSFLDYDIEYDLALREFGEEKTAAVRLVDKLDEEPIYFITTYLNIPHRNMIYLAADWAERVLWIFENEHPKDKRPKNAIQAARDFVDGKIDEEKLNTAWERAKRAELKADVAASSANTDQMARTGKMLSKGAMWAVAEAAGAATAVARGTLFGVVAARAKYAVDAYYREPYGRIKSIPAHDELSWQIRRFVDCMEAVQAGEDWPDLKATE